MAIESFINENTSIYIGADKAGELYELITEIVGKGIKPKDSIHVACAIYAGCDYFISTDKRLLKYHTDRIKMVDPLEFISKEVDHDE